MNNQLLCDALESWLQSADAVAERGRLAAAVLAGVGNIVE
jgi:hypothetical protein